MRIVLSCISKSEISEHMCCTLIDELTVITTILLVFGMARTVVKIHFGIGGFDIQVGSQGPVLVEFDKYI